jgi:hypothetical protein
MEFGNSISNGTKNVDPLQVIVFVERLLISVKLSLVVQSPAVGGEANLFDGLNATLHHHTLFFY